jgi:hypothetical protein
MFPLSGVSSPAIIRSSVDLPDPFGPITPMRLPSEMVNETFWKSVVAPKAFEIPCALRIGGNDEWLLKVLIEIISNASRRAVDEPCAAAHGDGYESFR